jgi:hypothetical protein
MNQTELKKFLEKLGALFWRGVDLPDFVCLLLYWESFITGQFLFQSNAGLLHKTVAVAQLFITVILAYLWSIFLESEDHSQN